jgi:hypothetical protein
VENTAGDSFDLYYGLFMYNKRALQMLERLDLAFKALKMSSSVEFRVCVSVGKMVYKIKKCKPFS